MDRETITGKSFYLQLLVTYVPTFPSNRFKTDIARRLFFDRRPLAV
jgi:hypothetical protein